LAQGTIRYTGLTTPHPHYPLDSVALRIYSPFRPVSYDLDLDSDGRAEYTFQSSGDTGFFLIGQNQNKLSFYPMDLLAPLPAGTVIGFDYAVAPETLSAVGRTAFDALAGRVAAAGEPFQLFFTPDKLASELVRAGFTRFEQADSDDLNERYFKQRADGLKLSAVKLGMLATAWV